jgi:phage tail-like protein
MPPAPSLGLNAAFSLATNLVGVRADPYQVFSFFVEIEGILAGGFSECTGLQVETEFYEYREGGQNEYVHHFAGATKYPPLILKHGLTPIDGLWMWHQDIVTQGKIERRNGTIYLLNRQRLPVIWWDFKEAFPYKWTGPELRADSGDVAVESVELVHRGLSRPRAATAIAGGINAAGGLF